MIYRWKYWEKGQIVIAPRLFLWIVIGPFKKKKILVQRIVPKVISGTFFDYSQVMRQALETCPDKMSWWVVVCTLDWNLVKNPSAFSSNPKGSSKVDFLFLSSSSHAGLIHIVAIPGTALEKRKIELVLPWERESPCTSLWKFVL